MRKVIVALIFLCLANACVVRPRFCGTGMGVPECWRIPADETSTFANQRWWILFGDCVLDELIAEALQNNRDVRIAVARVQEYYARLGIARAPLFPEIDASAAFTRQEASLATLPLLPGTTRISNTYSVSATLAYQLDLWGQIESATEAALADLFSKVEVRRGVVLTLVTALAEAYFQMRQYDKQLHISLDTLKSREESFVLAKARFEGGLTSELEVKQAESEVESAAVQVLKLQLQSALQENLISVLMGQPPTCIRRGLTLDEFSLPPCVPTGLPSELLIRRPDILAAHYDLIASNARVGQAIAGFFPQISLTAAYGSASRQLSDLLTSPAGFWNYGFSLLQPIFNGGLTVYQVKLAQAIRKEAYYLYQQTVLLSFQEVEDALIAHEKAQELVVVQKRRQTVLQEYLHLARLQYDNGQTDYLNVLDAERNLFSAQLDYAQAQSDVFLSLVNLYGALGGGWVVDADILSQEMRCCACDAL